MNMTTSLLLMYQVFQSLVQANANCDFATVSQRLGTLVKQLLAFDKDILGTPVSLRSEHLLEGSRFGPAANLKVHKKHDSLFWSVGEPIFNAVRDAFTASAKMAREDLMQVEKALDEKGPLRKLEEDLDQRLVVNQ